MRITLHEVPSYRSHDIETLPRKTFHGVRVCQRRMYKAIKALTQRTSDPIRYEIRRVPSTRFIVQAVYETSPHPYEHVGEFTTLEAARGWLAGTIGLRNFMNGSPGSDAVEIWW